MGEPGTRGSDMDARGLVVTAASREAVAWLDDAILGLVSHRSDTPARLERALSADPGLVVAHCMRGFGAKMLARRDLVPVALAAIDAARSSLAERGGTERERWLVESLARWCDDDALGAVERLEHILARHPRDLLSIKLSHAVQFMLGLAGGMRRSVERVLPAWSEADRGFAFVLGCHAFTLEETGELDRAETTGRRAHELDAHDVWGAHAVAHVLEVRDRAREGLAWMARIDEEGVNNFAGHLGWHRALFHLGLGETGAALALHDERVATHLGRDYRDVANASTLLWRLEHEGVDVGDRWQRLAGLARERLGDHALGFADVHYVLALTGAGDVAGARRMLVSMQAHRSDPVAVAAAEAVIDVADVALDRGVETLLAHRASLVRLGGSHVQRDVFGLVLIDAALRSGLRELADRLLSERLEQRPDDWWARARMASRDERAVA